MDKPSLSKSFIAKCRCVSAKRPRTVIEHILEHGHITTEELKDEYGYNHPPRAARDIREQGIPLTTFRVSGSDGRKIAAYRFGDIKKGRVLKLSGRTTFTKELKKKLIEENGCRCAIYLESCSERELQIDHRIPFEVAGDSPDGMDDPGAYMLLSSSANRAKSWSCEHCANWQEAKEPDVCRQCYWAYPDNYEHIAMRQARRIDILWSGDDVAIYDRLKKRTLEPQKDMLKYVKEIIERNL